MWCKLFKKEYTEHERLQAYTEVLYYEENGEYSLTVNGSGLNLARSIISLKDRFPELYEKRKQELFDKIMEDIKEKGERREE